MGFLKLQIYSVKEKEKCPHEQTRMVISKK